MNQPVYLLFVVLLFAASGSPTQDEVVGSRALFPAGGDCSRGLESLFNLGLPDVAHALYVNLARRHGESYRGAEAGDFDCSWLPGRAWLLKTEDGGKAWAVPVDGTRVLEVTNLHMIAREAKTGDNLHKGERPPSAKAGEGAGYGRNIVRCSPADPREDLAVVTNRLASQTDTDRYGRVPYGPYMILAANLHRAGFREEAQAIAGILLKRSTAPETVADAINRMADGQYETACDLFFRKGDWQEYSRALSLLLARFKTTWRRREAVVRLAAQVKERIERIEPPSIEGEGISEEDKTLAAAMADETMDSDGLPASALWILPWSRTVSNSFSTAASPVCRILQRRMRSIPMLIALSSDPHLTPVDASVLVRRYSYDAEWLSVRTTGQRPEENGLKRRPVTRGELAALFLHMLVRPKIPWQGSGYSSSRSPDGMWHVDEDAWQSEADWYKENKDKEPSEIALNYVANGSRNQAQAARLWFVENSSERDREKLERLFLGLRPSSDSAQMIKDYVTARGPEAAHFVRECAAVASNRAARSDSSMYKDPDGVGASDFGHLSLLTHTAEQLLGGIAAGTNDTDQLWWPLEGALSREKPNRQLSLVLASAVATTNVDTRVQVLRILDRWRWRSSADRGADGGLSPREHADRWRILLSDSRPTEACEVDLDGPTVADIAAESAEAVYGTTEECYEYYHGPCACHVDDRIRALKVRRELGRVAGMPKDRLSAFPCSESVTREERRRLVDTIMKAEGADQARLLATFSMAEILALGEESERNPDLRSRLQPLAYRIVNVDVGNSVTNECASLKESEGRVLDRRILETLAGICRSSAAADRRLMILVLRRPGLGGVHIAAFNPKSEDEIWRWVMCKARRQDDRAYAAIVSLFWAPLAGPDEWIWPVGERTEQREEPDEVLLLADPPSKEEPSESKYWDALGKCSIDRTDMFAAGHIVAVAFPRLADRKEEGSR